MAGCISLEDENALRTPRKYYSVSVVIPINYTEVERINVTDVEPKLNELGFIVERSPQPPGFTLRNWSGRIPYGDRPPELSIAVTAYERNGSQKADFDILYMPCNLTNKSRDDVNEQENITTYLTSRANEVATICNITLGWDKARWTWSFPA
ncbi:MAG: hypothetical protein WC974_02930 [Thermoplasmata archaeon]